MAILLRDQTVTDSIVHWIEISIPHNDICHFLIGVKNPEADEIRGYYDCEYYSIMDKDITTLHNYVKNSVQDEVLSFKLKGSVYRWEQRDLHFSIKKSGDNFKIELRSENFRKIWWWSKLIDSQSRFYTLPLDTLLPLMTDVNEMYISNNTYDYTWT